MKPVLKRPRQKAVTAMGRGASPPASVGRFLKKEKGKAHNSELWCVCICSEISVTQSRNRKEHAADMTQGSAVHF